MSDCVDALLSGEDDAGDYDLEAEDEDKLLEDDDEKVFSNSVNDDLVLDINTDEAIQDDALEEDEDTETPQRDKFITERKYITTETSTINAPPQNEFRNQNNFRGKFKRQGPRGAFNNRGNHNFRGNNRGNNRGQYFRPQGDRAKKVYINPSFSRRPNVWAQKPVMAIKPWSLNSNEPQQQSHNAPMLDMTQGFQRQPVHHRLGFNNETFQPQQPPLFQGHNVYVQQPPVQRPPNMQDIQYNINPLMPPPPIQQPVYESPPPLQFNDNTASPVHNLMQPQYQSPPNYQSPPPYQPQFESPPTNYHNQFKPPPSFQPIFEPPPPMNFQQTFISNNYENQLESYRSFDPPLRQVFNQVSHGYDNHPYNKPPDIKTNSQSNNMDNFIKGSPKGKKIGRNNQLINNFPKRTFENTNLQVVKTVDKSTEIIQAAKMAEEDEETRLYRERIEKQKQLREKLLAQKEERRKKAAMKQKAEEELKVVKTPAELLEEEKSLLLTPEIKTVKKPGASALNQSEFLNTRKVFAKDSSLPQSTIVLIKDLAAGTTEVKLRKLCAGMGDIQKCELSPKERQATIQFKSVASAHAFFKRYHRHMLDLSMIQVKLVE